MTGLLVTVLLGVTGGAEDAARSPGELTAPVQVEAAEQGIEGAAPRGPHAPPPGL